jgi:hypothetical protein
MMAIKDTQVLLDAFADARRSWDDLIALQPDIYAGGGNLKELDLAEFARRVQDHQAAIDMLSEALESAPAQKRAAGPQTVGISNRRSATDEAEDRRVHPPLDTQSPEPEDAAGRVGEQPLDDMRDRHTSHKAGSRSIAQKEEESRYSDGPMPSARTVAGAFGREQKRIK